MKIDFTAPLNDIYGAPLDGGKLTLGYASTNALLAPAEPPRQGETVPGAVLVKHYALALRISQAKEPLDIEPEEVVLIRERIAAAYQNPVVVGPAWAALSG